MKNLYLTLAALLVLPAVSFAASYHYVDVTGEVQTITASSASEALAMPADIAPTSGVALDQGILEEGDSVLGAPFGVGGSMDAGFVTYQYVDMDGNVRFVKAMNMETAITLAPDRHPNSGVIRAETQTPIPPSMDVPVN